eukprot:COSAG02_NODE_1176_length_14061_cov_96.089529_15_plen_61_part_00
MLLIFCFEYDAYCSVYLMRTPVPIGLHKSASVSKYCVATCLALHPFLWHASNFRSRTEQN